MIKSYLAISKDNEIVRNSSSGGAFSILTNIKLKENYKIYGCIMDENLKVYHIDANTEKERNKMRGSKYIQSNINDSYKKIEKNLKNNEKVVFSGTPCQIAAIYSYLNIKKIELNNFYTIEIICHGVGSNNFFNDYIKKLEKDYRSKAIICNFRSKSRPGKLQDMTVKFENGKRYHASTTRYDWFYSAYLANLILRPSCYKCRFACEKRNADITIADAWGENKNISNSLIICNTEKGKLWLNSVRENFYIKEVNLKKFNIPNMKRPTPKPINYDEFTQIYISRGYLEAQRYIGNNKISAKIKVWIINIADKINLMEILKKFKRGN